ncbi:MAG: hypothetical protein IGS39_26165 [Calothrix sp. C42_A2020_038]|nr:hypothetical protein [Calothrix sp. C42_A2020_038]
MVLIPAFVLAAWKQKKSLVAYIAGLATSLGLISYSIYCFIYHNDALAFINAQKAWRETLGFDWRPWWKMLMQITIGTYNYRYGTIKEITHPLIFLIIVGCGYLLWHRRNRLTPAKVDYGFGVLFLGLWLLAGDPLINTIVVLIGSYLMWHFRSELTPVALFYGLSGIGLLVFSGGTISLNRLVYGIVPVIVAFGLLFARYTRWGYMSMGFFAILLFTFSIRFAQKLWAG